MNLENRIQSRRLRRRVLLVQEEEIDALGDRQTSSSYSLHDRALAAPVRPDEAVAIPIIQGEVRIFNQIGAVEADRDVPYRNVFGVGMLLLLGREGRDDVLFPR